MKGCFGNIQHYLDVQFRLLRNDYIIALTDGLRFLQEQTQNGKLDTAMKWRHFEQHCYDIIMIYNDVYIGNSNVDWFGNIVYELYFDVTECKDVQWEAENRLRPGSLVCLRKYNCADKFIFCVLTPSDGSNRDKGCLTVEFQQKDLVQVGLFDYVT